MRWTIPNVLTMLRLAAAPGMVVMFLYFSRPWADWFAMLLFIAAAVTDWFDGYLARLWKQESRVGAMLDPIADKALVVIGLLVITGYSGMNPWILLPATAIMFREVFVAGLREYVGGASATLKVTMLAKYKTFAQMAAMTFLFATGVFEHYWLDRTRELDEAAVRAILDAQAGSGIGLAWLLDAASASWWIGVVLLWVAGALTLWTGIQYFTRSLALFREGAA